MSIQKVWRHWNQGNALRVVDQSVVDRCKPQQVLRCVRGEYDVCLVDTFRLYDYGANIAGSGPCALARPWSSRVDPIEQELENCDVARVDPTEQELGNYDVARVDPNEQELGNCNVVRVDPTEQELGNCDFRLLPRVSPGANPGIWPSGWTRAQIRGFGRGVWRFGREGELERKYGDLAEKVNSGANLERFGREGELGRKSGDLAEKVNSGANME
ncbi:hypothetical protein BHM03_00033072, partial [Ensete ventricosum]